MPRIDPIRPGDIHPAAWRTRVKIRFGQCDPAGIVYTPHYFDIFNGVVEDWFPAALGLDYHSFLRDDRVGLGYAHASADFMMPGFMGETLEVAVALGAPGRSSFALTLHGMKGGAEAVRGRLVVVCTALDGGRAIPIPSRLRGPLEAYRTCTA